MKYYTSYMDRQTISPEAHERLLNLEAPKKRPVWTRYGALAACAVLILGLGVWKLSPAPAHGTKGEQLPADQSAEPGIRDLSGTEDRAPSAVSNDQMALDTDTKNATKGVGFVADSGVDMDKMMLPMIPGVAYPDTTKSPQVSASIALPDGSFSVDLSQRDIELILWGSEEALEQAHFKEKPGNVPWLLFWDGFTLSGRATYDGQGDLWQVYLGGYREDERFEIRMAPGRLPPTCLVQEGSTVTEVRGVAVEGWSSYYDSDGDGVKEHHCESAFVAHDIGVRATFVSPKDDGQLSSLFISWNTYDGGGLTLDHLLTNTDIPAWREESFSTLAQARQEAEFAPYLPTKEPEGYGSYTGNKEFNGHLSYQEGQSNMLFVRWSRGYDNVEVDVYLPEDSYTNSCDPVDINVPASYDTRLYSIPWCDSVPQDHVVGFYSVTFRAQDMSLETVRARETEHDTGGSSFHFKVLHDNGVVVSYSCDGMTAQQVWALVEETL